MEIEFIEPPAGSEAEAPWQPPPGFPAARHRRRPPERLVLACSALLAASAVLAAVSPFQWLYRITATQAAFRQTITSDGWGRMTVAFSGGRDFGEHGPRFGIVVVVLAGLGALLALAGGWLSIAPRPRAYRTGLAAAGGAVAVGLGVAAVSAWFEAVSQRDNALLVSKPAAGEPLAEVVQVHTGYGPFLWLALGATACAAAATVAATLAATRPEGAVDDRAVTLADVLN